MVTYGTLTRARGIGVDKNWGLGRRFDLGLLSAGVGRRGGGSIDRLCHHKPVKIRYLNTLLWTKDEIQSANGLNSGWKDEVEKLLVVLRTADFATHILSLHGSSL